MIEYAEHIERLRATQPVLAAELASIQSLERLLVWMQTRGLDLAALDLIQQDEFCYDLLVRLGPVDWLSFGMG
jgi:hypothetical protein